MPRLSPTEREERLEQAIAEHEAKGYRVKSQTAVDAKMIPKLRKSKTAADLALTVGTLGFFAPLAAAGAWQNKAIKLHVDTHGNVTVDGKPYPSTK